MEFSVYAVESQVEATHWWFVGRRKLLAQRIAKLGLLPEAKVLEVGTGTGSHLRLLQELGFQQVIGIDNSDEAIRFCRQKGLGEVQKGDIYQLPFAADSFQLILATDIIEHVQEDSRALGELKRVLAADGWLIITVPAFQSLWGLQDEVAHHQRRYRLKQLRVLLAEVGLNCQASFYFNYLLFVPIWVARQLIRIFKIRLTSENQLNTPWLNRVLTWIFLADVKSAAVLRPPFGVSILAIVSKPKT
jgi:ubiquinone/menaquinone biosynthesis C-methylase UbiE